jgi:hypothetical protein
MKKVAATKGQSVRRTDFFQVGTAERGWEVSSCGRWALAVANFYVFLRKRLTLTTASPLVFEIEDVLLAAPGIARDFPDTSAKLVRSLETTENFHRCNSFLP